MLVKPHHYPLGGLVEHTCMHKNNNQIALLMITHEEFTLQSYFLPVGIWGHHHACMTTMAQIAFDKSAR